jgi:hypothetical protein
MQHTRIQRSSIQNVLCLYFAFWLSLGLCLGQRLQLLDTAKSYVGITELTGRNDGVEVERFLASVGFDKGFAWCGAFTSYCYSINNIPNPNSAWSPNWGLKQHTVWQKGHPIRAGMVRVRPGDAFTIYYSSKQRIGHVGLIYYSTPDYLFTIEGNTNAEGSREGNGVWIRKRRWDQIYRITSYIR